MIRSSSFSELLKQHQENPQEMPFEKLVEYPKKIFTEKSEIDLNEQQSQRNLQELLLAYAYFVVLLAYIYNTTIPLIVDEKTVSVAPLSFISDLEKIDSSVEEIHDLEKNLVCIVMCLMYLPIKDENVIDQFHQVFCTVNQPEALVLNRVFPELKKAFDCLHREMLYSGNANTRLILVNVGGVCGISSVALTFVAFQMASCALLLSGVGFLFAAVAIITIASIMQVPKKPIRRTLDNQTYCFPQTQQARDTRTTRFL
ncbi:MAG: hypothetical protein A3F10_01820 [Coxiella sp. RIFCSPHIGHO2_12_FULL_42_15]|nr:MAG: hypothetical protein A3F10_01820 [Coxiella sp. RIFCSPHIGHO2_12_FULL_42_15]